MEFNDNQLFTQIFQAVDNYSTVDDDKYFNISFENLFLFDSFSIETNSSNQLKAQSINTNENQIDFLELQEKDLMQELVQTLQNENYEFQQNQSNADINNVPDFAALQTTTSLELDQIDQIDLSMYQNIPLIDVEETSTANVPYFASQPITSSNNEELDQLDQIDLSLIQNFQLINFAETNITSLIECDEKDNIDGYLSENSNGEYNSCQSLILNSSKLNHNKRGRPKDSRTKTNKSECLFGSSKVQVNSETYIEKRIKNNDSVRKHRKVNPNVGMVPCPYCKILYLPLGLPRHIKKNRNCSQKRASQSI